MTTTPPCPRCGSTDTAPLRNYGKPVKGRFECHGCNRWFGPANPKDAGGTGDGSTPPQPPRAADVAPPLSAYQWLTTAPNPNVRGYGADDGQRGWRTHAVIATDETKLSEILDSSAACGLSPAHGWGMDMFIERKCKRCLRTLGILCLACRGHGDVRRDDGVYVGCSKCKGEGIRRLDDRGQPLSKDPPR